jgi:hypothetical protein
MMEADMTAVVTVLVALTFREVIVLAIKKVWTKTVDSDYLPKKDFDDAMKEVVTTTACLTCQKRQEVISASITTGIDGLGKSIDDLRGLFLVVIMNSELKVDADVINKLAKRG